MRLNLGCGENRLDGWENHDADMDVTKPLPFISDSVSEILIEHCLEHVSAPDMFRFLLEAKRILHVGGVLHISMPVIDKLEPDHARDIILGHGHLCVWTRDSMISTCSLAGFKNSERDHDSLAFPYYRPAIYGHWRVIGDEKDENESFRLKLTK